MQFALYGVGFDEEDQKIIDALKTTRRECRSTAPQAASPKKWWRQRCGHSLKHVCADRVAC